MHVELTRHASRINSLILNELSQRYEDGKVYVSEN